MILEQKNFIREADIKVGGVGKAPYKRPHLFVRCDTCKKEWWAIKFSFTSSMCYHKNNIESLDMCKSCRTKLDYRTGVRVSLRRVIKPDDVLFGTLKDRRSKLTRHSQGYSRTWVESHPRLHGKSGRVYTHTLVMEKVIGRFLSKKGKGSSHKW